MNHVSEYLSNRMRELYGPYADDVECLMADRRFMAVDTTDPGGRLELRFDGGPEYKALVVIQEAKGMRNREVLGWNNELEEQDC